MPLRPTPTFDDLIGDSLIRAVMQADRVEPEALRTLLAGAAARLDAGRHGRGACAQRAGERGARGAGLAVA